MKLLTKNLISILPILLFMLLTILSFAEISYAFPVAPAPILDSGQIEATILEIYHPANPQIDYGKVKINKILEYSHDSNANYEALRVGGIIPVYFQWGAQKTIVDLSPIGPSNNDLNLPGVKIGDKIAVHISGCPEDSGCGGGWTLYEYSIISKITEPVKLEEPDKTIKIRDSTEISTMLVEQKQVTSVENIMLDNQRYNVTGYRTAKLFWFIPVKLKLQFTVDAKTGNVESVTSPWWSFLAR